MRTNLEIYERLLKDFNRDGLNGVMPYFSDDIEVFDPDLPERTYRGREAVVRLIQQLLDGAERTTVRDYELLPAGDRVVALTHVYARGEGGAPEVEFRSAHTLTFRDGKVVHWRLYLDRAEALADAGLDPELAQTRSGPGGPKP
ncbi:MAG: nuclear transport factor 2 family protein [Solirubrobacterales bacterium]